MKMVNTRLGFGIKPKARLFWNEEESRRDKP